MSATLHPIAKPAGFLMVISFFTVLAVQITGRPASQAGKAAGSAGFPHFDRVLLLEDTSENSANVSIGDLNDDGNLDIVLAKGRHSPLVNRVLFNDGHGRFPVAHNLGEASDRSYSAPLVDIDGDGDLDVVISNDTPDPKLVYLNDGKGNFHVGSTYGRPEWPMRNARVADLNGDGLPDIIVANRTGDSSGSNYVCLNRGKGKFDADCIAFSHESATTITPADFNRDGFIDLAVPHREGGQSYVYLNDGKAGFSNRVPFGPPDAAIRMAEAADLNGDGLIDIVAIDERRRHTFIFFNQGNGIFSAGLLLGDTKSVPYALAVGDLNLDGKIDVVVGNVAAPSTVYFNDGSGRNFTPVQFGDNKGTAYGFAIGDLDKDGLPDIAVARSGAPNVVYFRAPPSRNYIPRTALVLAIHLVLLPVRSHVVADTNTAAVPHDAPIKIGAVVATRGPAALLGNSFVKAIQLAKEDLKNTTHQYDLVIEEITSPDKAGPAIEKLIKIDKVDALVVGLSISGQIVKPYATAAEADQEYHGRSRDSFPAWCAAENV